MKIGVAGAGQVGAGAAASATDMSPATAPDQCKTSLSPCSPSTRTSIYAGLIPRCAARSGAEPRRVEDRAGPDHPLRRNPVSGGEDGHNLRHDVDRIRRHQEDGVRHRREHCRHDLGKDCGVARQKIQPAFPGLLGGPGRKHDNARAVEIGRWRVTRWRS
jgi:hypothetical protein